MPSSPDSSAPPEGFPPSPGTLDRALEVVRYLRAHCPWDRKQTARSLIPHLLEETQETVDAIRAGDRAALRGELGDLLLNLAFQVVVAEEEGAFDAEAVISGLEAKMIRRHPHLFGGEAASWESIKAEERRNHAPDREEGTLAGLASGLDPLLRAYRMQERASAVGFDWDDPRGALAKVREELDEFEALLDSGDHARLEEETGDLLFSVVNVARLAGVHPLSALDRANAKFHRRFGAVEKLARERDLAMPGASLEALDELWDEIKRDEEKG